MDNEFNGTYGDDYAVRKIGVGNGVLSEEMSVELIRIAQGVEKDTSAVPYYTGFEPGECECSERPQCQLIDVSGKQSGWPRACDSRPGPHVIQDLSQVQVCVRCPMFARKISHESVDKAYAVLTELSVI